MLSKYLLAALLPLALASPTSNPLLARTSCSTPDGSGTCQSTSSCGGFHVAGYCPGNSDNQCCITKSCSTSSGSGTCKNTSVGCSGGKFVSGACPGDSSIECCVPSSSSGGGGGSGSDPHAINEGALKLIEKLEGFRASCYVIDGDTTCGYGHDCTQRGDCASIPNPMTQAQAEALLKKDLASDYEPCVANLAGCSGMNANEYGALVSFTYNAGCGSTQTYFESLVKAGSYSEICTKLKTTLTDGGELTSRRAQESAFCSTATSEKAPC